MTKVHILILILLVVILSLTYFVIEKNIQNQVISIPQIQIATKKKIIIDENEPKVEPTLDILSKLKMAVESSKKNLELTEEERAKEILETLRKQSYISASDEENIIKSLETPSSLKVEKEEARVKSYLSPSTEKKVLEALQKMEPKVLSNKKDIYTPKSSPSETTKEGIIKTLESIKDVISINEKYTTVNSIKKKISTPKIQLVKKDKRPLKKFILKKTTINKVTTKKVTTAIHHIEKKTIIIRPKKKIVKKPIQKIIKKKKEFVAIKYSAPSTYKKKKILSREEEVAQYEKASANGLEVVGVSNLFEINEQRDTLPDSSYFEPVEKHIDKIATDAPLKFVKTLGVVDVSSNYEVGNLEIPKMVKLAKEGVVDISSASVETEALKKLKFIDPLEVIEISPTFETIEAQKYIK